MNLLSSLGEGMIAQFLDLQYLLAVLAATGRLALSPTSWPRTVRNVLARQILFTGYDAVSLIIAVAFVIGISIVLQAQVWLAKVGQKDLLGPMLVVIVVREMAPLLANFVVLIRSASAIAAEMANMKLSGEVNVLDAQGLDPLLYLVMPRVVGMAICALCLAVIFSVVALFSGYVFGLLFGAAISPGQFINTVLGSIGLADVLNLLAKSVIPAALTASICCIEGLSVAAAATEIPRATSRGLARSIIALFVTAACVSVLTYL